MSDNEGRMRIWIPKKDRWVLNCIDQSVSMTEEAGRPASRSSTVLNILKGFYSDNEEVRDATKSQKNSKDRVQTEG